MARAKSQCPNAVLARATPVFNAKLTYGSTAMKEHSGVLERLFKIRQRGSTPTRELTAGVVTFMTMSYIIFLQPLILTGGLGGKPTGMELAAVMAGVCLASAFGSILMGLLANYPVALAPGMGENFFFLTTVAACAALGVAVPWQTALGVVFVAGLLFLLVSALNVRKLLLHALSPSMRHAIAAGIGLFIAFLGLKHGGVVVSTAGGDFLNPCLGGPAPAIFAAGLLTMTAAHAVRMRGAIVLGMGVALLASLLLGQTHWQGLFSAPPSVGPVFARMDLASVWGHLYQLLPFIVIFLFMDVFDTLGTLVGVCSQAGIMKDGQFPGVGRAMAADSAGTVFGSLCGNSTVTSYIESATGVEHGGRTGLTAVSTGLCFLLALFLAPLVRMVAEYPGGLNPITAPALVLVGALMMGGVRQVAWDDLSEAVPAFLVIAGIPFTSSIADGLALGFISYPAIKLLSGRGREVGWLAYVLGVTLLLYLALAKGSALA